MTGPALLLPRDPLNERAVDPEFARDRDAARAVGVPTCLLDHQRLVAGDGPLAIRGLPEPGGRILYRGWMMAAADYRTLEEALLARGSMLVTSADLYVAAHHLVGWSDIFSELTPRTACVHVEATADEIMACARLVGGASFVVKDWVKSRKHEWDTAVFAPAVERLPAVVAEFIRLQDEFLVGDIAIRRFVDLDKSQPEIRVWWAHGAVALVTPHPDFSGRAVPLIDSDFMDRVGSAVMKLGSPFVTTDLAMTSDGGWIVIEVGDGQVSGLPDSATEDDIGQILRAVFSDIA